MWWTGERVGDLSLALSTSLRSTYLHQCAQIGDGLSFWMASRHERLNFVPRCKLRWCCYSVVKLLGYLWAMCLCWQLASWQVTVKEAGVHVPGSVLCHCAYSVQCIIYGYICPRTTNHKEAQEEPDRRNSGVEEGQWSGGTVEWRRNPIYLDGGPLALVFVPMLPYHSAPPSHLTGMTIPLAW